MKIYTAGQYVIYKKRRWKIIGFNVNGDGHTVYHLKRGFRRVKADETEVE